MATKKNYERYLNSSKWRDKRRLALALAGHACQRCGLHQLRGLHVHHLTYERFGNERMEDLQVLCEKCHATKHMKPKSRKKIVWRGKQIQVLITKKGYVVYHRRLKKVLSKGIKSQAVAISFAKGADSRHP